MEQIFEHHVASRRTNRYERIKSSLLSCSNAISIDLRNTKWEPNFVDGLLDETKKLISCDLINLNNDY
ncbi:hypothetical protein GCM10022297_01380 [Lactobacillus hamsteri]